MRGFIVLTAFVFVVLAIALVFGSLFLRKKARQYAKYATAAMRMTTHLQRSHPHIWICILRIVNAYCRIYMVLDMLLDGAVCYELHSSVEEHPDLFFASLGVWLAPYACLWVGIFNLLCLLMPSGWTVQSSCSVALLKLVFFW